MKTERGTSGRAVNPWTGSRRPGPARFRKQRRPCGQPAAVGGIGCFRPLPPQAGHFWRINAIPSDFPFKSTGFAIYPVPPQLGQSSGFTPLPLSVSSILRDRIAKLAADCFALRITNKHPRTRERRFHAHPGFRAPYDERTATHSARRFISQVHPAAVLISNRGREISFTRGKLDSPRPERWQSGRMRRFAKPLYGLTPVPRVRIPPSPPAIHGKGL